MAIFRFSPGSCRKTCRCTRCGAGTAPRYWTATILGTEHRLYPARQNNLANCVWEKFLETTIGCDTATRIVLNLGETAEPDYFWSLEVRSANGTALHGYALSGLGGDPLAPLDCQSSYVLNKTGGTCGGSDTVTIAPGPPASSACCNCEEGGSSGDSGTGTPVDNGCCIVMPSAWDLEFPTPVWGDQSCNNCDQVVGVFHLPFLDQPPLIGARYRYRNLNWCTDSVSPCTGGPVYLDITLVFTAGCVLRAQLDLGRLLLDHEACAARCRISYLAPQWTPEIDCTAPITLEANNWPNANPCSGRTAGGPPPSPIDTLCDDFTDGIIPPQFITATAA